MSTISTGPSVIQVAPFEYDYGFDNAVCNFRRMVQNVCDDISKKAPIAPSMLLRQKMITNGDCVKSLAAKLGIPRSHLRKVIKYGSVLRGEYYTVLAQYLPRDDHATSTAHVLESLSGSGGDVWFAARSFMVNRMMRGGSAGPTPHSWSFVFYQIAIL